MWKRNPVEPVVEIEPTFCSEKSFDAEVAIPEIGVEANALADEVNDQSAASIGQLLALYHSPT
jgi:hypothetical protein